LSDHTGWATVELTSWEMFRRLGQSLNGKPGWLARGQADANWPLEPSLTRVLLRYGATEQIGWEVEKQATFDFIDKAPQNEAVQKIDWPRPAWLRYYWYPIMQHYGVPTRLLDWTQSLWVAAYFAVTSEPVRAGAVYWFNRDIVLTHAYRVGPAFMNAATRNDDSYCDAKLPAFVIPIQDFLVGSPRDLAQHAQYTFGTSILSDHGPLIAGAFPMPAAQLATAPSGNPTTQFTRVRHIIRAELKEEFRHELDEIGVNAATLFPNGALVTSAVGKSIAENIQSYVEKFRNGATAQKP
jgi:hypothetical protein